MLSGVRKMSGYLKGERPTAPTKKGKPEDIEAHEAGLRKLEEEARRNKARKAQQAVDKIGAGVAKELGVKPTRDPDGAMVIDMDQAAAREKALKRRKMKRNG